MSVNKIRKRGHRKGEEMGSEGRAEDLDRILIIILRRGYRDTQVDRFRNNCTICYKSLKNALLMLKC